MCKCRVYASVGHFDVGMEQDVNNTNKMSCGLNPQKV